MKYIPLPIAMHGRLEAVSFLLKHGECDEDEKDSCGTTPLMDAIRGEHLDIAKLLLEHHVRISISIL